MTYVLTQDTADLDDRMKAIRARIEGLRSRKIPIPNPVLRRKGEHFWIEENDRNRKDEDVVEALV